VWCRRVYHLHFFHTDLYFETATVGFFGILKYLLLDLQSFCDKNAAAVAAIRNTLFDEPEEDQEEGGSSDDDNETHTDVGIDVREYISIVEGLFGCAFDVFRRFRGFLGALHLAHLKEVLALIGFSVAGGAWETTTPTSAPSEVKSLSKKKRGGNKKKQNEKAPAIPELVLETLDLAAVFTAQRKAVIHYADGLVRARVGLDTLSVFTFQVCECVYMLNLCILIY
jgi:hypothetical protein